MYTETFFSALPAENNNPEISNECHVNESGEERLIISVPINITAMKSPDLRGGCVFNNSGNTPSLDKLMCWENNPNQTTSCGNDYGNTSWCR